jgi:hypothetical protein
MFYSSSPKQAHAVEMWGPVTPFRRGRLCDENVDSELAPRVTATLVSIQTKRLFRC